jgi:quercetin dioxygenase-like cupin family protein
MRSRSGSSAKWCAASVLLAGCAAPHTSRPGSGADTAAGGRPTVLAAGAGEARLIRGRKPILLKVDPHTVGSRHLLAGTEAVPPGDSLGRHRHLKEEEILFLNHGVLEVTLDGQTTRAESGGLVFIPPGTRVSARNPGPDTAHILFVFNEPSFALCLRAFSAPVGTPYVEPSADSADAVRVACHMRPAGGAR